MYWIGNQQYIIHYMISKYSNDEVLEYVDCVLHNQQAFYIVHMTNHQQLSWVGVNL